MKIAADYFDKGLGKSLGYLVGALVLGTALPHLLKEMTASVLWVYVIIGTSILAFIGGMFILLMVPDGPHRKFSQQLDFAAFAKIFRNRRLRFSAFGYFGHMWELYAFWAFVPVILNRYKQYHQLTEFQTPLWSFVIIGIGFLSCVQGGIYSQKTGPKYIALVALSISGICCLLFPVVFFIAPKSIFLSFLIVWGMAVIADSPMFSSLVAKNAPIQLKGTALTLVNCIGFAMTIFSIQMLSLLANYFDTVWIFSTLLIGPLVGIYSAKKI
jgi:MFS family permease